MRIAGGRGRGRRRALLIVAMLTAQSVACRGVTDAAFVPVQALVTQSVIDTATADGMHLRVEVSSVGGQLHRVVSVRNASDTPRTIAWNPFCELNWALLRPEDPMGAPRFHALARKGFVCVLGLSNHQLAAGETFSAPEWQVNTSAAYFIGDSLPLGTYLLGLGIAISNVPTGRLIIGPVRFERP